MRVDSAIAIIEISINHLRLVSKAKDTQMAGDKKIPVTNKYGCDRVW